jgi:hypothetical protein
MIQKIYREDVLIFEMEIKLVHLTPQGEVALIPDEEKYFVSEILK